LSSRERDARHLELVARVSLVLLRAFELRARVVELSAQRRDEPRASSLDVVVVVVVQVRSIQANVGVELKGVRWS